MPISLDEFMARREKSMSGDKCFKGYIDKAGGKYDKEARSARFVMSTEAPDREGDVIHQSGWKLDNFLKNAPLPVFHNTRSWPVGNWKDVEVKNARPKRLEGTAQLLPKGGPVPEVDQAAWMLEHGGMKAVSVGFIPLEMDLVDPEKGFMGGFDILSAELVECSLVPVPAHPDALMKATDGDMKLAREFIEEILDSYAKDPKTGLLISRDAYEEAYKSIPKGYTRNDTHLDPSMAENSGLVELAAAAERAEGAFSRLKALFGFKAPESAEIPSKQQDLPETDEKTPPNDDLERGIAQIVKSEALKKREEALIETLQAKGRV